MNINHFGILYVVATPIGNLQDITFRAVEVLKTVHYIAAEDTRHSAHLLRHFSILTPTISLHEHNEHQRIIELLDHLQQGRSIALISDAGTPLISDPGHALVKKLRSSGIRVIPIPGPCAAIAALSASGLASDRFVYEGFLPPKSTARLNRLTELHQEARTIIFYEAPHRILDTLQDMETIFGKSRHIVFARELTKMFETIQQGTIIDLIEWVKNDKNQQRGEMVILVEGAGDNVIQTPSEEILLLLLAHLPLKQAVEITAKITGDRKNALYDVARRIKHQK